MKGENNNKKHELAEYEPNGRPTVDRLAEEINILTLEGSVFCFDPKKAKHNTEPMSVHELAKRPVRIEPHPNYGQPSVLAYKILQAVFLKLAAQHTYPYEEMDGVTFSQRELARIVGRQWSGRTSQQLHDAAMQLLSTVVRCAIYDKKTQRWEMSAFQIFSTVHLTGKGDSISAGAIYLHRNILRSINQRHVAYFNLERLASLDVIGMVMYKRLFFHFSNIYNPGRGVKRSHLCYHKDYETLCREWLGGLTPQKHKSQILRDQLGRHINALLATGLIRKCAVVKNKDGTGFNVDFYAGDSFFEDYDAYYVNRQHPPRTTADQLIDDCREPMQVVAYFHELLGHEGIMYHPKETKYAGILLRDHSLQEVRDLTAYAVEQIRVAGFNTDETRWFNAVKDYREAWWQDQAHRCAYEERQAKIAACPYCNEKGMVPMKARTGSTTMVACPHDGDLLTAYEEREELRRLPS